MWTNPRWASLVGPDADTLRSVFQSLSDFLQDPSFESGIRVGDGTSPTYNPGTDVVTRPTLVTMDSENVLVLPATIVSGKYIRSGNYSAGVSGWNIDGNGNAEFNNVTVRGTVDSSTITGSSFRTNAAANSERIEITSVPVNIDGFVANYIRFYSPTSGGVDPYRAGRIFGDMDGSNTGLLYIRPPYATVGSGQAMLGLESDASGATRCYLGGGNASQPFLELRGDLGQANLFDTANFNVFGNINIGSSQALRAFMVQGAAANSRGSIRCYNSNTIQFNWDGNLHFYIDDIYVGTL